MQVLSYNPSLCERYTCLSSCSNIFLFICFFNLMILIRSQQRNTKLPKYLSTPSISTSVSNALTANICCTKFVLENVAIERIFFIRDWCSKQICSRYSDSWSLSNLLISGTGNKIAQMHSTHLRKAKTHISIECLINIVSRHNLVIYNWQWTIIL